MAKSWNFDKVALKTLLKIEIFDFAGTGNKEIWQSLESLSRIENFAKNWDFFGCSGTGNNEMDKDVLICVENYAQYRDFDHSGTRNNGIWQDLESLSCFRNKLSSKSSHIFDHFRARLRMAEQWNLAKSLNFESHWKFCSIGPIEIFDHPGTGNSKIWQISEILSQTNFAQNSDL